MERIMTHLDIPGRLVKWRVEHGEYENDYQLVNTIKAQALTDFLTEMASLGHEEVWIVFVYGTSSKVGSGA